MLLRTLGGLELEGTAFHRPKPLLLLAYLALEGPQERGHLAELFFRGSKKARGNLSVALSRLRHGAPGAVGTDNSKVWAEVQTDAQQLLTALEGEAEESLRLYGGRFLEGVSLDGSSDELEEWVYGTREFLASQVQRAYLRQAEGEVAKGNFDKAAKQAESAYNLAQATIDPATLKRLHTLLLAGGKLVETKLREELAFFEVPLCRSREEARQDLLELFGNGASSIPNNLQARETSFVGRDLELAEISQLLREHRLVTLLGSGGVGKSRLALQMAQKQLKADTFKDGVFFVALDALTSPTAIPTSIARALSLTLQGSDEPLSQVSHYLADKQTLLILDNFEHLMQGATFASDLLAACPKLSLLITSRERLNLEEEWHYRLGGLSYPKDLNTAIEDAKHFDAVQLFVERAQQAKPGVVFDENNLSAITKLCQLVEGLPLALELAATWTRAMSCQEIVHELENNLDLLSSSTQNIPDKHKSIKASFEHSYRLLTSKEQACLRNLSVFKGGFRREAASDVVGATLPILAGLVDKSLLRLSTDARYDSHPLLYKYCQAKLAHHPEEYQVTRSRHGDYYLRWLCAQKNQLWGSELSFILKQISEDIHNIHLAWAWAIGEAKTEALDQAIETLDVYYEAMPRFQEAMEMYDRIIHGFSADHPGHHGLLAKAYAGKASQLHLLGRNDEAVLLAEQGLTLLDKGTPTHHPTLWLLHHQLGMCFNRLGDYPKAKEYVEQALRWARQRQDKKCVAMSSINLAWAQRCLGEYPQAQELTEDALSLAQRNGYRGIEIAALLNLGESELIGGHVHKAHQLFEEGLELVKTLGYERWQTHFLIYLSKTYYHLKRFGQAKTKCEHALHLIWESGATDLEAIALTQLGKIYTATAKYTQASDYLKQSLTVAWSARILSEVLECLLAFAELQAKQGQSREARYLASCVLYHPATEQRIKDEARQLLLDIKADSAVKALARTTDHRSHPWLETAIEEILGELPAHY